MAVSGLVMLLYLVVHMLGNLKIFFGPGDFNDYAHWLRTLGEPALHYAWSLWIIRVALVAVGDRARRVRVPAQPPRPEGPAGRLRAQQGPQASYATRTMRWGGVILALFVVWHLLDLTTRTRQPATRSPGHPYQNVVATFHTWYGDVIYIVAMLALGLHVRHGLWSAAQTLGVGSRTRDRALKAAADGLALLLTAGFIAVPVGVMTGVVH